jgi:hypothetical protein
MGIVPPFKLQFRNHDLLEQVIDSTMHNVNQRIRPYPDQYDKHR